MRRNLQEGGCIDGMECWNDYLVHTVLEPYIYGLGRYLKSLQSYFIYYTRVLAGITHHEILLHQGRTGRNCNCCIQAPCSSFPQDSLRPYIATILLYHMSKKYTRMIHPLRPLLLKMPRMYAKMPTLNSTILPKSKFMQRIFSFHLAYAHAPTSAINVAPLITAAKASHLLRPFRMP